jgi:predicted choloylglycine hydrolase
MNYRQLRQGRYMRSGKVGMVCGLQIAAILGAIVACAGGCGGPSVGSGAASSQASPPVRLDLARYYQGKLFADPNSKSDFRAFAGKRVIDGLPFNVDGVVTLYGQSAAKGLSTGPNDVTGIRVGRKFDELHLVHTAGWPDVEGTAIAVIRLNYDDGSKVELPIVYGGHVRDWNRTVSEESEKLSDKNSKVCWRGAMQANKNPRLFKSMLKNPHPDRLVATMDAISTRKLSSYRLCAATVASRDGSRVITPPVASPEPPRQFKGKFTVHVIDKATGKPMAGVLVRSTMILDPNRVQTTGQPCYTSRNGDVTIPYPAGRLRGGSMLLTREGYCTISQQGNDIPPEKVTIAMEVRDPERLYAGYDKDFQKYLAAAVGRVGKDTMKLEPLSSRYSVPKKLTIDGTPYQIGQTIGYVAKQAGSKLPMLEEKNRRVNEQVVELYRRIYPEYLEMARGMAEAYGVRPDKLDMRVLENNFVTDTWCGLLNYGSFFQQTDFGIYGYPIPEQPHSCSVASYYVGGHQLVGRNFDNPSDRPHYFTTSRMDGCYRVIGHTIYGINTWVTDGINEKGLSLSGATNGGKYYLQEPYPDEPAIVLGQMQRIVLDKCATVDEALALIGKVRVWCPNEGIHWLIADTTGRSVVVEWDLNHKMVVFDKKGLWELMTNTALQEGEPNVVKLCWRYRKAKPQLEAGVSDTAGMLSVMKGIRNSTLWTSVMDLNGRTIEVHYYKEFDRKYEFSLPVAEGPSGR